MEQPFYTFFAGLGLISIILGIVLLVFVLWSVVWAYSDARRRGKPGWLVALLVLFMVWPIGLLLWLFLRPQYPERQV
jgi:Flp pilus assembly protein protease CpaA